MKSVQYGIPAMVAAVAAALVTVGCGPSGSGGGSDANAVAHVLAWTEALQSGALQRIRGYAAPA